MRSGTIPVNRVGDQFLARAAGAENQNGTLAGSNSADEAVDLLRPFTVADHPVSRTLKRCYAANDFAVQHRDLLDSNWTCCVASAVAAQQPISLLCGEAPQHIGCGHRRFSQPLNS